MENEIYQKVKEDFAGVYKEDGILRRLFPPLPVEATTAFLNKQQMADIEKWGVVKVIDGQ